ncbi:meiosis-specific protein ASY1-like [Macadamia integrifolia]|uniref:meiosis-specific protein ASY1-like n=1 Tax=Macadamia integrifolia TaxID=60698 RepID=UPI001C4F8FCE|nr:meiosis-specific protein ASY1-like [Macadamia integrifolia]
MDKLVKEGVLSRAGRDNFTINKLKNLDSEFAAIKEEKEAQEIPLGDDVPKSSKDDYMYMKALYHALPMEYVTVPKLQSKLEGEANQATVKKLIEKMAQEGFVEGTGNRRLGKRVIHSETTNRKLQEIKNAITLVLLSKDKEGYFWDNEKCLIYQFLLMRAKTSFQSIM